MLRNFRFTRRAVVRAGVVLAAALGLVIGAVAAPASAAEPHASSTTLVHSSYWQAPGYVALGDSYTSGQGAPPYDGGACLHSRYGSFPSFAVAFSRYRLTANLGCSGADTTTVASAQLPSVPRSTAIITLTVGGIDAGSDAVLAACAPDPASDLCTQAIQNAAAALSTLQPKLTALYAAIATQAPNAKVLVLSYPHLFNPGVDAPLGDAVNAGIDVLDGVIQGAVAYTGNSHVVFVDVRPAFAGHGIGAGIPYINLTTSALLAQTNFHPNYLGNLIAYPTALRPYGL